MKILQGNDLYPPMMAGIATTYARNFNDANGLGPLPKMYQKFPCHDIKTAHDKVIQARNKIYAHRDINGHSYSSKTQEHEPYTVYVQQGKNEEFLFCPIMVDIPPSKLVKIKELIEFQMARLQDDLDNKLALVLDFDKTYEQGVIYTLGRDFP